MSPALSAYLDLIRLLAALMVFANHASYPRFDGGWVDALGGYGHESVVVFFVLSGFVIAFSHESKDRTARQYAASRLSRLWSVAAPAIVLTLLMDAIGGELSPDTYAGVCSPSASDLAASFLFVNQTWFADGCVGSNLPYWSLSYEFFYYLLFAVFIFARFRWFAMALAALLAGPKVLLLLPCWAIGVVAFHVAKQPSTRTKAFLLTIGALALFLALAYPKIGNKFVTWRLEELIGSLWSQRLGRSTEFVSLDVLGVLFAAHLVGMARLLRVVPTSPKQLRLPKKAADATFGIYLLHYPCLMFFTAISLRTSGVVHGVLVGLASLAIPILLTPLTEAFKRRLRPALLATFGGARAPETGQT